MNSNKRNTYASKPELMMSWPKPAHPDPTQLIGHDNIYLKNTLLEKTPLFSNSIQIPVTSKEEI